jgi:formylglycine-generating enzyme required for sulfatase activity
VIRGGGYSNGSFFVRSSARHYAAITAGRANAFGFRVARTP